MYFKTKSFICLFFIIFSSIADEKKIAINFTKIFPESNLENFYKMISYEMNFLKNYDFNKDDMEVFLEKTLDFALDLHSHIFLLKKQIKQKNSYFKEDLENLISFINKINSIFENVSLQDNAKKQMIHLLFSRAVSRLNELIN